LDEFILAFGVFPQTGGTKEYEGRYSRHWQSVEEQAMFPMLPLPFQKKVSEVFHVQRPNPELGPMLDRLQFRAIQQFLH